MQCESTEEVPASNSLSHTKDTFLLAEHSKTVWYKLNWLMAFHALLDHCYECQFQHLENENRYYQTLMKVSHLKPLIFR